MADFANANKCCLSSRSRRRLRSARLPTVAWNQRRCRLLRLLTCSITLFSCDNQSTAFSCEMTLGFSRSLSVQMNLMARMHTQLFTVSTPRWSRRRAQETMTLTHDTVATDVRQGWYLGSHILMSPARYLHTAGLHLPDSPARG